MLPLLYSSVQMGILPNPLCQAEFSTAVSGLHHLLIQPHHKWDLQYSGLGILDLPHLRCLNEYWLLTKTIEAIQILWSIYAVAYQLLLTVLLGSRAGNFLVSDFWMAASHHPLFFCFQRETYSPLQAEHPARQIRYLAPHVLPCRAVMAILYCSYYTYYNIKHSNNYFTLLL